MAPVSKKSAYAAGGRTSRAACPRAYASWRPAVNVVPGNAARGSPARAPTQLPGFAPISHASNAMCLASRDVGSVRWNVTVPTCTAWSSDHASLAFSSGVFSSERNGIQCTSKRMSPAADRRAQSTVR